MQNVNKSALYNCTAQYAEHSGGRLANPTSAPDLQTQYTASHLGRLWVQDGNWDGAGTLFRLQLCCQQAAGSGPCHPAAQPPAALQLQA